MTKWQAGLIALGINIVLICVSFKILDIIDRKILNKIQNQESNSPLLRFIPVVTKLLKFLVVFIAIVGLLQSQGYTVSSILAGFGIGGLAVGMAAKETIANVFGSFSILSDRVYRVGDYVKVNDIEGYVEDINIRSTKIRNLDNFLITLPNDLVANAIVTNVSRAKKRLLNLTFGVTYSTNNDNLQKAQEILGKVASEHKEIHDNYTVAIHDLGESSINIRFRGYCKTASYDKFLRIRGEYISKVIEEFRAANIDFAFPSRSIYIEKSGVEIED